MLHCWHNDSKERPTFFELVQEHKRILNSTSGAMEMDATRELVRMTVEDVTNGRESEGTELRGDNEEKTTSNHSLLTTDMLQHGVVTDAGVSIVLKPSTPDLKDIAEQKPPV